MIKNKSLLRKINKIRAQFQKQAKEKVLEIPVGEKLQEDINNTLKKEYAV